MSVFLLNDVSFLEGVTEQDVDYVKQNAADGDAVAQYHLALMFDAGRGVTANPQEAEKWYKKAAGQGHANAAYYLARMYSTDTSGIKRDDAEALKWYKVAADLGHLQARKKVAS